MKRIELSGPTIDSLKHLNGPEPSPPAPGEVLVKMRAAAFNFLDVAVATGKYPGVQFPVIPIADGAGEILAVGAAVEGLTVGDRVALHAKPLWIAGEASAAVAGATRGVSLPGSLIEISVASAASVVKAPDHLSWEQIASLPIPATTAWRGLQTAGIGPGSHVVVLGTGVVSLQAITLAKAMGARVIVTSSSDEKLASARALGADDGINYTAHPEWQVEVRRLTGGVGADLVIETVGGDNIARSIAAVRQGGIVFAIGFLAGSDVRLDLLPLIGSGVRIIGSNTGSVAELREAMAVIATHRIQPVIAKTFSVSEIGAAYRAHDEGNRFGKIAVTLDW